MEVGGGVAAGEGGDRGSVGGREVGVVASEKIGVGVSHGGVEVEGWAGAGVELKIEEGEEVWMGGRWGTIIEREGWDCWLQLLVAT